MKYSVWEGYYHDIISDFNFSEKRDKEAAKLLNSLIEPLDTSLLEEKLKGKRANVYGTGPSLELIENFPPGIDIAADGATSYLLENRRVPDIVVTDLDGDIEDLLRAKREGSIFVVHAHGDNMDAIKMNVPKLGQTIGTTQTRPLGKLYNYGGFTDGDRAVFLAHHFGASEIHLYGMDFGDEIGRYSFTTDVERKRRKLKWAEKLINHLIESGAKVIYEGRTNS